MLAGRQAPPAFRDTRKAPAGVRIEPLNRLGRASGLEVDMHFAQVWTVRDGKQTRMEMYADPAEALEAVGLER